MSDVAVRRFFTIIVFNFNTSLSQLVVYDSIPSSSPVLVSVIGDISLSSLVPWRETTVDSAVAFHPNVKFSISYPPNHPLYISSRTWENQVFVQ